MQDSILWAHIFINMLAFGILFPVGMVLGVSVPLTNPHPDPDASDDVEQQEHD